MKKKVWPVASVILLGAFLIPCVVFYLYVKEYESKLFVLQQEFQLCQRQELAHRRKYDSENTLQELKNEPKIFPHPRIFAESVHINYKSHHSENINQIGDFPEEYISPNVKELDKTDEKTSNKQNKQDDSSSTNKLHNTNTKYINISNLESKLTNNMSEKNFVNVFSTNSTTSNSSQHVQLDEKMSSDEEISNLYDSDYFSTLYTEDLEAIVLKTIAWNEFYKKCYKKINSKQKGKCKNRPKQLITRRTIKKIRKTIKEARKYRLMMAENKNILENREKIEINKNESKFLISEAKIMSNSSNAQRLDKEEAKRISTDFKRSFNQKILRMEESLTQFVETQSGFCKDLRYNLGDRLEKRGRELGVLSDQIASFVKTTTDQVRVIEKLASNQVFNGQSSIEKLLQNMKAQKEKEIRRIQDFHMKIFLPTMTSLSSNLGQQAAHITSLGVQIMTKVENLQEMYLTFAVKHGDILMKVSEDLDSFSAKQNIEVMRSRDHVERLRTHTDSFIREIQMRMNNVVKEIVLVRLQSQNFASLNENTYYEVSHSLNRSTTLVDNLVKKLQRKSEKAKNDSQVFKFKRQSNSIVDGIREGVNEALEQNEDALTKISDIEQEERTFTTKLETAWDESYSTQETELRQEVDRLSTGLRNHNHHTQNILSGLQGTAGTHELVLEEQKKDFEGFIKKRQDTVDTQCSSISDWATLISSELRKRDEDVNTFSNSRFNCTSKVSGEMFLPEVRVENGRERTFSTRTSGRNISPGTARKHLFWDLNFWPDGVDFIYETDRQLVIFSGTFMCSQELYEREFKLYCQAF